MREYALTKNHCNDRPTRYCFFDTETVATTETVGTATEQHTLRLGVSVYCRLEPGGQTRRKEHYFRSADEFWKRLISFTAKGTTVWVFAHNLGFDLQIINFWGKVSDETITLSRPSKKTGSHSKGTAGYGERPELLILDDPPTVIKCTAKTGGKLCFVDTLNYWRVSLRSLGSQIGLSKQQMPVFSAPDESWFDYCRGDVLVIEKAVLGLVDWVHENDYGKFRLTQASQAMGTYRHRFMKHKIYLHEFPDAKKLERNSYYGGRLQLFYSGDVRQHVSNSIGTEQLWNDGIETEHLSRCSEVDIVSMYPYIMRQHCFPNRLVEYRQLILSGSRAEHLANGTCIVQCTVNSRFGDIPLRNSQGTIFPTGTFHTTLAGPEFKTAYERGEVEEVQAYARYELAPLFREFVDHFWARRKAYKEQGNSLYANFTKIFLNSLYGKFGQLEPEWVDRPDMVPPVEWGQFIEIDRDTREVGKFRAINGLVQQRVARKEHKKAFPAIAAFVTSYARELIRRYRDVAGHDNCYYVVTDALYVNDLGLSNLGKNGLLGSNELGKLEIKNQSTDWHFSCLHNNHLGQRELRGSVKASARPRGDNEYVELHFAGIRQHISKQPTDSVEISTVTKTMRTVYTRGTIQENGWIRPLHFDRVP